MRARLAFVGRSERSVCSDTEMIIDSIHDATAVVNGRSVVNFASANYLGLPGTILAGSAIAFSAPRALAVDRSTLELERDLARLVDRPAALVGPSTLHVLTDVVRMLVGSRGAVLVDKRCYTLGVSAAITARGTGAYVRTYEHFAPKSLERALAMCPDGRRVVLCDGVAMPGIRAPLAALVRVCERAGAVLVIDDTQGFGLFGDAL